VSAAAPGTARRYARALLDVASEKKAADAIAAELRSMVGVIAAHKDLASLLAHPAVSAERKRKLVGAVAARAQASELLTRLLTLLGERDRLALLPAVAEAYTQLLNASRGVVAAEAVSAVPLDDAQAREVSRALGALLGREVALSARVDPRLLGGMLVTMNGRTYDGSVRARLAELRRRLAGTEPAGASPAE
jgi:F-type H+-transporting ATPase subunit delta